MKSPLDKPFDKPFKKPDGKAQRVRVVNTPGKTTLIIPSASKIDAGIYTLTLTSEEGSASVDISVKVIGKSFVFTSSGLIYNFPFILTLKLYFLLF